MFAEWQVFYFAQKLIMMIHMDFLMYSNISI